MHNCFENQNPKAYDGIITGYEQDKKYIL